MNQPTDTIAAHMGAEQVAARCVAGTLGTPVAAAGTPVVA